MTSLQTLCAAMLLLVVHGEKRNPKQSMQVNGVGGLQQTTGLMRRSADVLRHSFKIASASLHESDSGILDHCKPICPSGCDGRKNLTKRKCYKCAKCHGLNPADESKQEALGEDSEILDHCTPICPSGCDGIEDATKRKCYKCAKCHGINPATGRREESLVDIGDSPDGDVPAEGDDSASTGSSGKEGDDDPSSSETSSDDTSKGTADDTSGGSSEGASDEKSAESDEKSGEAGTDDGVPSEKDDKYDAEDQEDEKKYKNSKRLKTSSEKEDDLPDPSLDMPKTATAKTDGENGNITPGEDDLSTDYNHDMQPDVPTGNHIPESLSQTVSEKNADDTLKTGSMVDTAVVADSSMSAASSQPDDDHPTEPGHDDDEDSNATNSEVADADQGSSSDSQDAAGAQDGEDASHKTEIPTDADAKSDNIGDEATGWTPQGAKNESPEAASDKGENNEGA